MYLKGKRKADIEKKSENPAVGIPELRVTNPDSPPAAETFSTPFSTKFQLRKEDDIKRRSNGRIEFSSTEKDNSSELSPGESFVKEAWPQALLAKDVMHDEFASIKKKVSLRPELRLATADSTIFIKLAKIQSAFRITLVPY